MVSKAAIHRTIECLIRVLKLHTYRGIERNALSIPLYVYASILFCSIIRFVKIIFFRAAENDFGQSPIL